MKRVRLLGLASLTVLILAACGQKGPLYMPEEEPEKSSENQKPEPDEVNQDEHQKEAP
ncbi:LPS translocon maturation chaperone LptM [Kangiella marina]